MHYGFPARAGAIAFALASLVFLPSAVCAQSVSGQAAAVIATVAGSTSTLGGTGPLSGPADALSSSVTTASLPLLGSAENLSADSISSISTWSPPDEVSSQASLANLSITVAGHSISAGFILSQVTAPVGGAPQPVSMINGLAIAGVPVNVSGSPNQVIQVPGLRVVLDEVTQSAGGTTVNALHITSLDGLVDVIVASATAGVQTAASGGSTSSGSGLLSGAGSTVSGTASLLGL